MDAHADSLRFAAMADAAASQAAYRGLEAPTVRPEVDVRRAVWWRVRGLQRAARLPLLLGVVAIDAAALLIRGQHPQIHPPFWIYLLPLLTAMALGMAVVGCRRASRMASAARKPGQLMRYTLLHSYLSETPWLVIFADSEGDEAEPLGLLPLRYGPLRNRFRELPPPAGEAVLAGELLPGAAVVPWIDGHAYWPASGFQSFDPEYPKQLQLLTEMLRLE
ncbi:hypothetical protein ACFV8E_25490 [Streptomyces sp. NPDC059849]|uniref:hypothetical protein n=1 Tax=Streptomyces sp. NPDC059849 TaxID=3346969 RepID=UPI0036490E62